MALYLEDDYGFFESQPGLLEKVEAVVKEALKVEQVPYETEISLTVADKEEIREINQAHREIDKATDVLSFPQIEPMANGVIEWDELDETMYMNLDTDELMLGDIVLCHEVAKEQAESYGHSFEREVCFLVAHSMFHLLGYDHMNEEDEKLMIAKQEEVLKNLGITR
ncbi:MAG: rRNA maturation RNase YbeY [Cellulosilyticaceae bacterium]